MSKFSLNNGEEIILKTQSTAKTNFSLLSGQLYLTNKRIVFVQGSKQIFEISLDKILDVSVVKEKWMFGARIKQLYILHKVGMRQWEKYLGIINPEIWRVKIKECMTLMLNERWGE